MAKNYSALTGSDIVRAVRKKHIKYLIYSIFGIIAGFALLIAVSIYLHRSSESVVYMILGVLMSACIIGFSCYMLGKSFLTLRDILHIPLFRKYGSADSIAMQISEHFPAAILESNKVLITDSFIMKHGDYETYIPYEDVLLLYRKEHRTNGVLDSIFLVVYDAYGDNVEYPFKLGKKHADDMDAAAKAIASRAPNCRFGYTKENLAYVQSNKKPLP